MALKSAKQVLRKEIKKRVAALSTEEKLRQSSVVVNKLLSLSEYQNSKRVSVYLSMPDEVRTDDILSHLFESGKECFIPKYVGPRMDMVRLRDWADHAALPVTAWNIKQPADDDAREDALETGGLDLIVMPGLGFSASGDRLGRGKGYYDSYLQRCRDAAQGAPGAPPPPRTVALAFREQMCDSIPTSPHDVPVDVVLFEEQSGA